MGIDHGWLHNFFSVENTPGDGVNILFTNVFLLLTIFVNGLPSEVLVFVKVLAKLLNDVLVDKELIVGFLVNISFFWTPSEGRVSRFGSVNSRLRIDCKEFVFVHGQQRLRNQVGLISKGSFREWELFDSSRDIVLEDFADIIVRFALSSPLLFLLVKVHSLELFGVAYESLILLVVIGKSWGSTWAPTAVRELIPFLSPLGV